MRVKYLKFRLSHALYEMLKESAVMNNRKPSQQAAYLIAIGLVTERLEKRAFRTLKNIVGMKPTAFDRTFNKKKRGD